MKKKMIFIWLLMLGTLTSCQSCSSEYKNVNEIIVEELEIPVPLGDPFILLHNGTYYAYGTHSDEGIEVYISDNLKTWKYKGLALNKKRLQSAPSILRNQRSSGAKNSVHQ